MKDIRILCYKCIREYTDAGYNIKPLPNQTVKQQCDICTKPGYECIVEDKSKHDKDIE